MTTPPKTADAIAAAVRAREIRAEEVCALALGRVDDAKRDLNAFLDVFHERALEMARAVDARIDAMGASAADLPLAGVPVAVKDNICCAFGRTTCASRFLERYTSPFNADAVARLLDAGAVIVAKTNLDEFGMGSSGEHSAFGPTRNPRDHALVPGGSSSGSAAAVAAGAVPLALGSDTGGSIRQPAGLCGCVGLKPTYGRVSRYGLVAYASSLDQIGPLAATVRDAALCLAIIQGEDPRDATSSAKPTSDLLADLDTPPPGLRVGIPRHARGPGNHPAVTAALRRAEDALRDAGCQVVDVDLPAADHAIAAYYVVAAAEASSNLARFDGVRYGRRADAHALDELYTRSRTDGFGPEVRRRIMLGTHVLSSGYHDAYYLTALRARRAIKADYDRVFDCDTPGAPACGVMLMPTSPGPAFPLGSKLHHTHASGQPTDQSGTSTDADPMAMYLEDIYTVGVNLAGLPAVAIPCFGAVDDAPHLPVGLQLIGPAFAEPRLLRAARLLEAALAT